jgi:hypothetical protein
MEYKHFEIINSERNGHGSFLQTNNILTISLFNGPIPNQFDFSGEINEYDTN